MGEWPARLGPGATQALRASRIIPDGAKLVWMEHWLLDTRGSGCWLTHEQLGARLGMTARSVETYRLRLEDAGCMVRLKEGGLRAPGWRATLPEQCRAVMRSQRPAPGEVDAGQRFLDRHVKHWPPEPLNPSARNPQIRSPKPAPVRVSELLSTAFDSQSLDKPSPALSAEGSRSLPTTSNAKAEDEGDLPQSVLPQSAGLGSEPRSEPEIKLTEAQRWDALRAKHRAQVEDLKRKAAGR